MTWSISYSVVKKKKKKERKFSTEQMFFHWILSFQTIKYGEMIFLLLAALAFSWIIFSCMKNFFLIFQCDSCDLCACVSKTKVTTDFLHLRLCLFQLFWSWYIFQRHQTSESEVKPLVTWNWPHRPSWSGCHSFSAGSIDLGDFF